MVENYFHNGSAADAMHFSAELVGKFKRERDPIDSICLNTNISNMTAIVNDYSYENICQTTQINCQKE